MKILIMSSYYERPKLVRNMLASIVRADHHHKDWELVFGDDGSSIPGRPIVEEVLRDYMDRVRFVHTGMTLDDKIREGISLGRFANEEIKSSDSGAGVMLCDDDELHPHYLKNLSDYFESHPDVLYCYSKIKIFNPLCQKTGDALGLDNKYNRWDTPINPVGKVDASQVAWRLDCNKVCGARFADSTSCVPGKPWVKDTDKGFFESLHEKCGPCHPTGFVAQYKGVHDYQLLWHKNTGEDGLRAYDAEIKQYAGVLF